MVWEVSTAELVAQPKLAQQKLSGGGLSTHVVALGLLVHLLDVVLVHIVELGAVGLGVLEGAIHLH